MSRIFLAALAALFLATALVSPITTEAKAVTAKRHKFIVNDACNSAGLEGANINADDFTCTTGSDGSCIIEFPDYKNIEDVPVRISKRGYKEKFRGHEALALLNIYDLQPVGGCKKE